MLDAYVPVCSQVTPLFSDKPSFPAKIFHSWTQPRGEFTLESLSQIFLQVKFEAGKVKAAASLHVALCPQNTMIIQGHMKPSNTVPGANSELNGVSEKMLPKIILSGELKFS